MARPRKKLTRQQILEVETLAAVLSVEQIADYFGMGKTTFYEVMERQPGVSERYKKGKAKAISEVASGLLTKARSGDTASAIFYLKTQAGWCETQNIAHNLNSEKLSKEQRDAMSNELLQRESGGLNKEFFDAIMNDEPLPHKT